MILLQDSETCRQARLVLREFIKGDKSRVQLWNSQIDNQLDDVDLRFLLPPLANEGYIEESEGMWHILDKGVKYMQTYDRMIMESIEGYPYRQKKSKEDENLILQRQSFKWTKISVIVSILIALIGWIAPRLDGVIAAILTLFHE
mgnify:FL=1|jgi:hypothetical protein